jgi:hypothetical protein
MLVLFFVKAHSENHDSWVKWCNLCKVSQIVITTILIVMSGLDPHMISGYGFGMVLNEYSSHCDNCLCDNPFWFCVNHYPLWII